MSTKRMLIDAAHSEETRVVVLSGNRLEELDVESASRKILKGNIYLAKVARVEPSLQAAFVEYGGNRHGFLPFSEIHPDYYQIPVADREALIAEEQEENKRQRDNDGNGAEGEDGTDVEVLGGDDDEDVRSDRPTQLHRHYKIQEVIKRRQILLIQVVKEERGSKGAALTTYLSLAGRYCVLMPNTPRGGGISRKIGNVKDRRRLRTVLNDLDIPEGMAIIVRTAGAERTKAEIRRDYEYLLRLWNTVRETTLNSIAPCLVHEEANLIKRSIRDLYGKDIDEVIVEGEEGYRAAKDFMKMLTPSHAKKVKLYKDEAMPLLHRFQVEGQLDGMHSPTVQLRSGGYLVINPTEALVAIDVNSGRSTRERSIEETALRTNLEAAEEIARQLRLRDLAGLIVIDFIDMESQRNQTQVEKRLKEAMRHDRARIQIGRISPFGLLELSRQRLRPSLLETSTETCTYCAGTGVRRSVESTVLHVLRAIEEEGIRQRSAVVEIHVPLDVAFYLLNQKRTSILEIESRYDVQVRIAGDDTLIAPDYRLERLVSKTKDEVVEEIKPQDTALESEEDGGRKKRRRRRSRKRRPDGEMSTEVQDVREDAVSAESEERETPESDEDGGGKRRRRGRRGGRKRRRSEGEGDSMETSAEETVSESVIAPAIAMEPGEESAIEAELPAAEALSTQDAEADVEGEQPTAGKKPRTRRRRKKAEEVVAAEVTAEEVVAEEATAEEVVAEEVVEVPASTEEAVSGVADSNEAPATAESAPVAEKQTKAPAKPRRPRTRRTTKKDQDQEKAAAPDTAQADGTVEPAEKEEKPKRRRASRAKKAAESESPADAPTEKDETAAQETSSIEETETQADLPTETAGIEVEAKEPEPVPEPEPIREEVMVQKTDGSVEPLAPEAKVRRGWWRR